MSSIYIRRCLLLEGYYIIHSFFFGDVRWITVNPHFDVFRKLNGYNGENLNSPHRQTRDDGNQYKRNEFDFALVRHAKIFMDSFQRFLVQKFSTTISVHKLNRGNSLA